jgi:hypothetical protein
MRKMHAKDMSDSHLSEHSLYTSYLHLSPFLYQTQRHSSLRFKCNLSLRLIVFYVCQKSVETSTCVSSSILVLQEKDSFLQKKTHSLFAS